MIYLSRALVELLPQRDFISRRNLYSPMRFNGGENNVRWLIFLLPAVTEDFHQVFSLIFTVLSRAHLRPIQPFPESQPYWS